MTIKTLAKLIAKHEGKKVQVNIAQINEILGVLSDLVYKEQACPKAPTIFKLIYMNGKKELRRKNKAEWCNGKHS